MLSVHSVENENEASFVKGSEKEVRGRRETTPLKWLHVFENWLARGSRDRREKDPSSNLWNAILWKRCYFIPSQRGEEALGNLCKQSRNIQPNIEPVSFLHTEYKAARNFLLKTPPLISRWHLTYQTPFSTILNLSQAFFQMSLLPLRQDLLSSSHCINFTGTFLKAISLQETQYKTKTIINQILPGVTI